MEQLFVTWLLCLGIYFLFKVGSAFGEDMEKERRNNEE